ncbi:conserved hypothetical protein [Catenulispora acidiphila DSM 44928]|uniref:Uncharacterized protein n=2 Tax=Catenulispora TaxID=414878 RepID=C7PX99_CATAD|nr:conserved hypothetical protein [Catenulispora acidiphila DSM 44928]
MKMVAWLAQHARPGVSWDRLALQAFDEDMPVPSEGIRRAFTRQIDKTRLPGGIALDSAPGTDRETWAVEAAETVTATGATMFRPLARIARIDSAVQSLLAAHAPWPPQEYADLDRRTDTDRTPAEITQMAVAAIIDPENYLPGSTIADVLAALLPEGQLSPMASFLEFSDLDATELTAAEWLGKNMAGSILEELRAAIAAADIAELRQAYRAAQACTRRTGELLNSVEAEIGAGTLGDACRAWVSAAAFGLPRIMLLVTARDRKPHEFAISAALLLWTNRMVSRLRSAFPGGFTALDEPLRQMVEGLSLAVLTGEDA